MKNILWVSCLWLSMFGFASQASAECFGNYPYRVCTDSYSDSQGNVHIRSYDSEGHSYSVDTESHNLGNGSSEISSHDSEGNSYSVHSWSDSSGVHSTDSEGNTCTITPSGTMIGCN